MTRTELVKRMSMREFIDWIAFFDLENRDRQRAQEDAEDKANAQQKARQMAGRR